MVTIKIHVVYADVATSLMPHVGMMTLAVILSILAALMGYCLRMREECYVGVTGEYALRGDIPDIVAAGRMALSRIVWSYVVWRLATTRMAPQR